MITKMKPGALLRILALSALALLVSACSGLSEQDRRARILPSEHGLWALDGERLVRLNGNADWERATWNQRANLPSGVEFVIFHPALRQLEPNAEPGAIRLDRVSRVRSQVAVDGSVTPLSATTWATSHLDSFRIPLQFRLVDMQRDMRVVTPSAPLEPGLYSLEFRTPQGVVTTRLGIGWPAVNKQAYSAATCVDRYVGTGPRYRPCAAQAATADPVAEPEGLSLYLVSPQTLPAGAGRDMVVQGVIVNNSDRALPVPPLTGYVQRNDGETLRRWQIPAPVTELQPQQSIPFRTEVWDLPPGAYGVRVRFEGR